MQMRVGMGGDAEAALAVWTGAGQVGDRPDLDADGALLVVADDAGRVVGMAVAQLGPDRGVVHLVTVAVDPAARRRGIGGGLVEALADEAYLRGARRLTALAGPGDAVSRAFLEAAGLRPTGEVELPTGEPAAAYDADLDPPARDLAVREAGLRLGQLLKLAGWADTGTDARELLSAGAVAVNGEVEQRRGRQLADGDVVVARDQAVRIVMPG